MRVTQVLLLGHRSGYAEYIGRLGERWQTLDIPYADRVRLDDCPIGLLYVKGADDA